MWHFLQCWNRYYYTRQWFPHLENSGKYTYGILILTVTFFEDELNPGKPVIIVILAVGTLYILAWDILMDFGFRRFFTAVGSACTLAGCTVMSARAMCCLDSPGCLLWFLRGG